MKQKKRGLSLLLTLLILGILPLLLAAVFLSTVSSYTVYSELRSGTFSKLSVAAESVAEYFEYDVLANGAVDYDEYSDHTFMKCMQGEDVELTLFRGDTRFLTSLKNADGSYNEGTQASTEVFAAVSAGKDYQSDDVVINGVDYYVYYKPIYDANGQFWGMAFAGTPQSKIKAALNEVIVMMVLIAVVLAVVLAVVVYIIANKIKKNITILGENINKLSEGDLSARIDLADSITEIQSMIDATNNLQNKMSTIIGTVKDGTVSLAGSIGVVSTSANESSTSAEQISGAMDELARATMTLSESVQQVDIQAQSMGDCIQGIADNIQTLSSASAEIKESTENAQDYMNRVMKSSEESTGAVKEITRSIALTNDSIGKITEAVKMITDIASQTNLLSLNASIEAARAGEAGRGFAVVATEIANLSQGSAQSAETIRKLAEDMKTKSADTVNLAAAIGEIIEGEQANVKATQSAFEMLGASIEESLAMIDDIDAKALELTTLRDGIVSNISDLSAISEENAATNQEVTASVVTIAQLIHDMSGQSDSMKSLSDELENTVSYFK